MQATSPPSDAAFEAASAPARTGSRSDQPNGSKGKTRSMTYPRKRAITACEHCRTRKIKCNNDRPVCSSCAKLGAFCSYDQRVDHSSFDPASLLILERLNQVLHELDHDSNRLAPGADVPDHPNASNNTSGAQSTPTVESETLPPNLGQDHLALDGLQVPSSFSSADEVLAWPIFGNRFPRGCLVDELFIADHSSSHAFEEAHYASSDLVKGRKCGICEDDIPGLVDRFLYFVHIKNPILDSRSVRRFANRIAENGLDWDAPSCVVLLACALGAVATSFQAIAESPGPRYPTSTQASQSDRALGDTYYQMACKRLGLLDRSIVACQCHLLSAIYLMYTIRPLQAWFHLRQASSTYAAYLKGQAIVQERRGFSGQAPNSSIRRFEQRLYWTCFKSECEIRCELNLAASELPALGYPYMFPSPPTPSSPLQPPQDTMQASVMTPLSNASLQQTPSPPSSVSFQKAEEQSWFYYLSEIALRRIENRVLYTFYKEDNSSWSRRNVLEMAAIASDFEMQLQNWEASLPQSIRFRGVSGNEMDELRCMTQGRYLGILSLLYRPFIYHAVHNQDRTSPMNHITDRLARKGLMNNVGLDMGLTITHRHHGTWFVCRMLTCWALTLLAAEKCGLISWDQSWLESDSDVDFGRKFRDSVNMLRYWEAESPDILKAREVVETLYDDIVNM